MQNRQPAVWAALCVFIWIVRKLPHKQALKFAGALGAMVPFFTKEKTRVSSQKCAAVLGISYDDAYKITTGAYVHFAKAAAEFARLPLMVGEVKNIVRIHGEENLKAAMDRGRGAILATAHLGNWEYAAAWCAQSGYPINGLGTDQRDDRITQLIIDLRSSGGTKALGKATDLRAMFRALSAGEIIAVPIDQDAKRSGVVSPFLGMPASTPIGVAKLAGKYGCAVLPAFCVRSADGVTMDFHILPALQGRDSRPYGEDIQSSIDDCNAVISEWIKKYPDQWLWLYPRWESVERGMFDEVRN